MSAESPPPAYYNDSPSILIENLYTHKDAQKLAERIVRMFTCLGVSESDILSVVVHDHKGKARVYLSSTAAEEFVYQTFWEVRDVMNFYDVRKLTAYPMGLKVSKRRDECRCSSNASRRQSFAADGPNVLTEQSDPTSVATDTEETAITIPTNVQENIQNSAEKTAITLATIRENPSQEPSGETSSTTTSVTIQPDFVPLEEEEDSSICIRSNEQRRRHILLDASTSISGFPDDTPAPKAWETTTSKNQGEITKVDVKTSTPQVSPCFCPETIFYHKNQHVGSETRHAEFKRGGVVFDLRSFRSLAGRYLCAFLNTEGGVIYFGVTDDGKVVGIEINQKFEDDLRLAIDNAVSSIKPSVATSEYSINFAKVMNADGIIEPGLKVLEICVHPRLSTRTPYSLDGSVYVRRDGSLRTV